MRCHTAGALPSHAAVAILPPLRTSGDIPTLICELCRQFYTLGWVSGTGGGIAIRGGDAIYMAPSGVQKERIEPADIFTLDALALDSCRVVNGPADNQLRVSECQPLFYNAFRSRQAGAVIHSHSPWAALVTRMVSPSGEAGVFECEGWEMQKGLRGKGCFDRVRIPIIANTAKEADLTDAMAAAMEAHPDVDAVLVAGHGVYVWGQDWVAAKTQAECLDYLFRVAVQSQLGSAHAGAAS